MTRFLKHAAMAAFAVALAAPSQAQQGYGAYDYVPGPTAPSSCDSAQSPAAPDYVPCPNG